MVTSGWHAGQPRARTAPSWQRAGGQRRGGTPGSPRPGVADGARSPPAPPGPRVQFHDRPHGGSTSQGPAPQAQVSRGDLARPLARPWEASAAARLCAGRCEAPRIVRPRVPRSALCGVEQQLWTPAHLMPGAPSVLTARNATNFINCFLVRHNDTQVRITGGSCPTGIVSDNNEFYYNNKKLFTVY